METVGAAMSQDVISQAQVRVANVTLTGVVGAATRRVAKS
jgi:hypothetical protein